MSDRFAARCFARGGSSQSNVLAWDSGMPRAGSRIGVNDAGEGTRGRRRWLDRTIGLCAALPPINGARSPKACRLPARCL
eukprot:2184544-Alexandrium_andersonii.AAC.1